MGTLNGLVLLACMLYLAARSIRLWQPLITLGGGGLCGLGAAYSSLASMYYEIFGTAALFGTIFMLSEPCDRRHPGGGPAAFQHCGGAVAGGV